MLRVVLIFGAIAAVSCGGYYYWSQSKFKEYEARYNEMVSITNQYKKAVEAQKNTIEQLKKTNDIVKEENSKLTEKVKVASNEINNLQETLRESNLEELSKRKPKLIEKRINDATRKVFDSFESITAN